MDHRCTGFPTTILLQIYQFGVYRQPKPIPPPTFSGVGNEYWPKCNEALQ